METKTKKPKGWGKTLKPDKVQAMKKAFLIHRSNSTVSKLLSVSMVTVRKYRKAGKWDELAGRADEKVNEAVIEKTSKDTIDNIEMVQEVKRYVWEALKEFHDNKSLDPTVNDLDKIVRLEAFLKGDPDSRPGNSSTITQVNIEGLSEKEIDEKIGTTIKTYFSGNNGVKSRF